MMDFHNESYVRVYTRNTTTWRRLGWDGQCVMMQMLRVVDMSGVLDLEGMAPVAAVVLHTGAPAEIAERGLSQMLALGVIEHRGDSLIFPRFQEAQEANKSDKQRQREARDRRRSSVVTAPLHSSQIVTDFESDENSSREIDPSTEKSYTLSQCSALQGSALHCSTLPSSAGDTPSHNVTELPIRFRRPLPEEPGDLPPVTPPLWRVIIRLHAEHYGQKRPGLIPPRREEAAEKLAAWCVKYSRVYKTTPLNLAERVLEGLFESDRAGEHRWPLGFAARDPEEYLPPPDGAQVPKKPLVPARDFGPGRVSTREELERAAANNPDWVEAAQ